MRGTEMRYMISIKYNPLKSALKKWLFVCFCAKSLYDVSYIFENPVWHLSTEAGCLDVVEQKDT